MIGVLLLLRTIELPKAHNTHSAIRNEITSHRKIKMKRVCCRTGCSSHTSYSTRHFPACATKACRSRLTSVSTGRSSSSRAATTPSPHVPETSPSNGGKGVQLPPATASSDCVLRTARRTAGDPGGINEGGAVAELRKHNDDKQ